MRPGGPEGDPSGSDTPILHGLRITACVAVALYLVALLAGPRGPHPWRELGFQVTALGLIASYTAIRAVRDRENRGRLVPMAGWMVLMAAGNALANGPEAGSASGLTSLSTLVFICAYPFALAAVVQVHGGRWGVPGIGQLIEAVVSTLAIAAVFVSFILPPALETTRGGAASLFLVLAFPVFDLVVAASAVAAVALSSSRSEWMSGWLALGLALFVSADWHFALGVARGDWQTGQPVDAVWVLGCAVVGLMAAAGPAARRPTDGWGVASLGISLISAAAAVSVLAIGTETRLPRAGVLLAVACVVGALLRLLTAYLDMRALAGAHLEARTDELTGLANRRVLYEALDAVLEPGAAPAALFLADLNRFKQVNDRFGHEVGDRLLVAVADRLRAVMPPDSTLVRLGGDEFAAVVQVGTRTSAVALAREFADAVAGLDTPGDAVVGASVGVVETGSAPGLGRGELLRRADIAMYRAKHAGTVVHRFTAADGFPRQWALS